MKKVYRVWAQSISDVYVDIEADSEEKAMEIAEELDGSVFHDDGICDWIFGSVVEMEDVDPDYIQEEFEEEEDERRMHMVNEIKNEFVWDLTEKNWKEYPEEMLRNLDAFDCYNTAGVVGSCRIGDLCFDFRAWGDENGAALGYELYVGGVDSGYNETPNGYPYDLVTEYGEFDLGVLDLPLEQFKETAERVLREFILKANDNYKAADLVEKANQPLNVF